METRNKLISSKKQIFSAWLIAIVWDLFLQYLGKKGIVQYGTGNESWWMVSIYIVATILLLHGLWNGSRSVGEPLSINRFFNLLFGFPNWLPVAIYLVITFFFL